MEGGVKGQIFTAPLFKQSLSCVFSLPIIALTIIMMILKGDITDFEIHVHLPMSWLSWRMVEPPGHDSKVALQAVELILAGDCCLNLSGF